MDAKMQVNKLDGTNYRLWSYKMEMLLKACVGYCYSTCSLMQAIQAALQLTHIDESDRDSRLDHVWLHPQESDQSLWFVKRKEQVKSEEIAYVVTKD